MGMMKRVFLFLAVNFLVVITLSFVINFFGLYPTLTATGYDLNTLLAFCLVWGMGGAFISLALSKVMAKFAMGVRIIDPNTLDMKERALVSMVHRYAQAAGLSKMPEVGIYNSPEVNAFATGPSRSNSLVAVSTGLLNTMDNRSVEGVIGHEVAHIANGDMVTMTLIQGVVNAFVMALARIVAFAINQALNQRSDRESSSVGGPVYFITVMVLEMIFMILGSIVVMWFSRQREFRADLGGAKYAGKDAMIAALESLRRMQDRNLQVAEETGSQPAFASLKISSTGGKLSWAGLFRTHPTLEERIERLKSSGPVSYVS